MVEDSFIEELLSPGTDIILIETEFKWEQREWKGWIER